MPPDEAKPPQPPEKPTTQLPAVPQWAIELTSSVKNGFAQMDARLETLEDNHKTLADRGLDLGQRMTSIESRMNTVETSSLRPRLETESKINLQQEAVLATLIAKVDVVQRDLDTNTKATLALKTALIDDVRGFLKNHPQIAQGCVGILMLLIGLLTGFLKAHQ